MVYLKAFLSENLGDDLFVEVVTKRYPKTEFMLFSSEDYAVDFGDNVCFAINKIEYKKMLEDIEKFNRYRKNKFLKKMLPLFFRSDYRKERLISKKADANVYVIGSGFMEGGERGFWKKLTDKLYFKNNLYLLGCNFGPYYSEDYRIEYKNLFSKAKDICFRDSYSYNIFKKLDNVRWESDIVFSYNGDIDMSLSEDIGKYIVISAVNLDKDGKVYSNKVEYYKFLSKVSEWYLKRGTKVVFVGFCKKQNDNKAIEGIVENISENFAKQIYVINYPEENILKIMGVFKNAEAVFASRYHAGILGMLFERQTYFLSYSEKVIHVLQDIDEKIKYVDITSPINVSVNDFVSQYGYCISTERLRRIKESANKQFMKLDKILK